MKKIDKKMGNDSIYHCYFIVAESHLIPASHLANMVIACVVLWLSSVRYGALL